MTILYVKDDEDIEPRIKVSLKEYPSGVGVMLSRDDKEVCILIILPQVGTSKIFVRTQYISPQDIRKLNIADDTCHNSIHVD